jgi:hypothetical protein
MDFGLGFSKVQGRDCIYVVMERLTKYVHFFSIPSEYNASQVVDIFFREVVKLHGLPRNIVSYWDNRFLIAFWKELTASTNYHPQKDGKTEIVNKWIKGYLRNYVSRK